MKKLAVKKAKYVREVYAHHINAGPLLIATIEHYPDYKNFPYRIEKNNGARFVTQSGHDCFARIADVKVAIQKEITEFYANPEFLQ